MSITGLPWIDMPECVPLMDWLIVDYDVRFWQEANEAIRNAQLIGGRARVVGAA